MIYIYTHTYVYIRQRRLYDVCAGDDKYETKNELNKNKMEIACVEEQSFRGGFEFLCAAILFHFIFKKST